MNDLQVFDNPEFGQVRTIEENGRVLFVGSDVAKALGYKIPHKAISDHCRGVLKRIILTSGGRQVMNVITEGDIYRLAAKSELPGADKFEGWIFDEVIPSIRKHGAYMTPAKLEEVLLNPDTLIQLAQNLKAEQERSQKLELENKKQGQIINELQPKATYYDLVLQSKSAVSISKIAKDYGLSGQALNKILNELGVQYKQGDVWLLYQKHADKGYTQSKTVALPDNKTKMHTNWTQKGRLFIYDLLKNERGILPIIEREQREAS